MVEQLVRSRKGVARDRLLEATSQLLISRDTLEVSLAEIAAAADVNHGLVQYYFSGKEGLLLALLRRDAGAALDSLRKLVEFDLPPLKKLELHIRGVIRTYFRHPYINGLINLLQDSSPQNAAALANFFIKPLHEFQKRILTEARDAGLIRDVDPVLFYFSTIGACDHIFKSRRILPYAFDIRQIDTGLVRSYSDHVTKLILDGLRPERRA